MTKKLPSSGFTLIETITAVVILSLILSLFISSVATLIRAEAKVRESFEASLLLDRVLLDMKASESFERFELKPEGRFPKTSIIPGGCDYEVRSDIIAESKNPWNVIAVYRKADIELRWRDQKQSLSAGTILREKKL